MQGSGAKTKEGRGLRLAKVAMRGFVGLVVALLLAEFGIRTFWPVGQTIFQPDERLLFAPIPSSAHVQFMAERVGGERIVVRINEHGFRGPSPDEARRRPRWMVFGDSFVMGENVDFEKTFGARLEHRWQGKVEVLSSGVTGYGPDQTLLRMEQQIPEYKPDGVILVLCSYNDMGDLVRNHLVGLDEGGGLVRMNPTVSADELQWFEQHLEEARKPGLIRLWNKYSELRNSEAPPRPNPTLIADYLRAAREDYKAHVELGETVAHGLMRDIYDADVAIHPQWPSSQYKQRLLGVVLGEIRSLCESNGVELICIIVPGGIDMDPDSWLTINPKSYPSHRRDRLCSAFEEACASAGVAALNLFPHFEPVRNKGLYMGALDVHWNAAGMDLGAQVCVEYMAKQGLLPAMGQ